MPRVTVIQHEDVSEVGGVNFIEVDEVNNLTLLDEQHDFLAVFATGTWASAVKTGEDDD